MVDDHGVFNFTEKSFKDGNKSALMGALYISLINGRLPPPWALQALVESTIADPKSWDEVFGRPRGSVFRSYDGPATRGTGSMPRATKRMTTLFSPHWPSDLVPSAASASAPERQKAYTMPFRRPTCLCLNSCLERHARGGNQAATRFCTRRTAMRGRPHF